ncbi:hypothetical protein RvY_03435 [Ramazzottius varieornatus]|uniref:Tudor domain-containing protein n=1 Tax=Ramazzottius varieornatus TaxID=947166 RepID=A0A1D1UV39_RAMVA|nr:hypothetical protein RvY_03435 [Ramazzottius varieornatus]
MENLGADDVFHNGSTEHQRMKSATRGFPSELDKAPLNKKPRPSALCLSTSGNAGLNRNLLPQKLEVAEPVVSAGFNKEVNFLFGEMDKPETGLNGTGALHTPGLPIKPHLQSYSLLTPTGTTVKMFTFPERPPPSSEENLVRDIVEAFRQLESVSVIPEPQMIFEPVFYSVEAINALFVALAKPGCRLDVIDVIAQLNDLFGQFRHLPSAKGQYLKKMPAAGTVVLAPYKEEGSVEEWFRGLVTKACADDVHCDVLYSDFGNSTTIPFQDLMVLPASLCGIAPITVPCRLAGFGYGFQAQQADTILRAFREIISKEQGVTGLTGHGNGNSSADFFEIELFHRNNRHPIQQKMAALGQMTPPGKVANRHGRDIVPFGVRKVRVKAEVKEVKDCPLQFYAWPDLPHHHDKVKAKLRTISQALARHFSNDYNFAVPEEGCLVAVQFRSHNYRGVVTAVSYVTKTVAVRLMDWGLQLDKLAFWQLRPLQPVDMEEVPLAIRFRISWADDQWARLPQDLDVEGKRDARLDGLQHFHFEEGQEYEVKVERVRRTGEEDELYGGILAEQVVEALMKLPADKGKENAEVETSTV